MDPNLPHHWQVIDTKTNKVVGDNLSHRRATELCEELEPPGYDLNGFRYVMEPVRQTPG